jgi:ElaB/YqjD/DUF883 family membrane-anchored ribosome-binding protein
MNDTANLPTDKLVADLKALIADAEELLKLGAGQAGDEAVKLRERLQARLSASRDRLIDVQDATIEKAKAAGRRADDYVHQNPWSSIGLAAAVGVLVGVLIGRR